MLFIAPGASESLVNVVWSSIMRDKIRMTDFTTSTLLLPCWICSSNDNFYHLRVFHTIVQHVALQPNNRLHHGTILGRLVPLRFLGLVVEVIVTVLIWVPNSRPHLGFDRVDGVFDGKGAGVTAKAFLDGEQCWTIILVELSGCNSISFITISIASRSRPPSPATCCM